jgi:hypothetical protein
VLRDLAGDPGATAFDAPHRRSFSLGLRQLALGDRGWARPCFTAFERARGEEMEGEAVLVQGILAGDGVAFNEGLAAALEARVPPDDAAGLGVVEQWISVEHLALARLGLSLGLAVTVSHPLTPWELLGRARTRAPDPETVLPPVAGRG